MRGTVVLFDAGNTLVEPDWAAAAELFATRGFPRIPEAIREAAGRLRPDLDRHLAGAGLSTESRETRGTFLGLLLAGLAVPPGPDRDLLAAELGAALPGLWTVPAPGALETVDALLARGIRVGVVSNSDGRIGEKLDAAGFGDRFEVVVDSGAVGVEKPDPGIFRIALRLLSASPEDAWYVGDLPAVDLAGARAAGLEGVLVDPFDVFTEVAAPRIRALPELLDLLHRGIPRDEPV